MYKVVRSSRLYEQIVQQVEESIQKGALKVGDKLPPERDLAEQFGVSRTAVREAVKALREKGMVEAYPGRGTFVMEGSSHPIRLSLDRMVKAGQGEGSRYLTEVREMMEPEIAAMAAERADGEDVAALRESLAVMDGATASQQDLYAVLLEIHRDTVSLMLKSGTRSCDVYDFVRERCVAAGFPAVASLVGHSIGVWWHQEEPMLVPGESRTLEAGMVICLEPILNGYWHLQDELLITEEGCVLLSDLFNTDTLFRMGV